MDVSTSCKSNQTIPYLTKAIKTLPTFLDLDLPSKRNYYFRLLSTTFEASIVFEAARAVEKISSILRPNQV